MKYLVRAKWVVEAGPNVLTDGAVLVDGERIAEVGDWGDLRRRFDNVPVYGGDRYALLPGLVNAHHHSAGVTSIAQAIPDRALEPWLLSLASGRPADPALETKIAAARQLRSGITRVVDVHQGAGTYEEFHEGVEARLEAYRETGIRAALAVGVAERSFLVAGEDRKFLASLPDPLRELAERRLPGPEAISTEEYFESMRTHFNRWRDHSRVSLWFGPPGPQWVHDETLVRMGEVSSETGMNIQTHLEESVYEKFAGPRMTGRRVVEHLDTLGVLGPRFSCAHGVWLSDTEIELLAARGAAISHNPSSNLRLRSGIAPLNALIAAGVTTGIGLDGTTMNDNDDMWQEMRLALRLHRTPGIDGPAPEPDDIFALATTFGAALYGGAAPGGEVGSRAATANAGAAWYARGPSSAATIADGAIATGAQADLVLLDITRITRPWVAPEVDPLSLLVYRASASDVDSVFVGGRRVVEDGRVLTMDEPALEAELADELAAQRVPEANERTVRELMPYVEAWYRNWKQPGLTPRTTYNSRD
ncbi:MAG: amidohydrolase family protein [Spirochaetales bacterium]